MRSKFSDIKSSMAAWYRRLGRNVKVIILSGFAIVILLCLVPTVFSGWATNYSGVILNRFITVDDKIGDLSSASTAKMIKVRRNEKDFLLSNRDLGFNEAKARYITTSLNIIADIKENMSSIRLLTNDSEIRELSNKIDHAISEYQAGLVTFIEIHGILGNENAGLEGKLNSVAYDMENILKQEKNTQLMVDLLTMRMSEKDYLINDLDIHSEKLQKAAERFKADIETRVIMPDHKKKLIPIVDTYTALFRRYEQLSAQLDTTRHAYLKSLQNVEPMLEKLHYISTGNKLKARDRMKRVERIIKIIIFFSLLFVIFLSSAMALFVFKRIKGAEERLKISENKYRLLFETSPDSMIIMDMEHNIIMINMCTHALLRQDDPEELIGKSIEDIIVQEDRQAVKQLFKGTSEVGTQEMMEFRMIKSDGSTVYVEGISSFIVDVQGKPEAIILVARDITDRRRAEMALKESERLLREAQIIAGLGSYVLDISTGVLTTSDLIDAVFGIDQTYDRSMEGLLALVHPDDRTMIVDYLRNAASGQGETFDKEYRIVRHYDQTERWVHWSGKLEFDDQGRPFKIHCTVQDITDRKKLEEQLLQSQKLEAIGTLAAGIAHDFNNLLQGVFGYISIAKLNATNKDKSIAALEQAEKALHMSVSLTSQLMTFSKGGKPIRKKIPLKQVIENSVRFALSGSRVDYRINVDSDLRYVDADEGQIGQVIQNIVLNADQAMPEGGTIVIAAKNVRAPGKGIPQVLEQGRYVEISVQDNGTGIAEEYLSKIFDPYFTTKAKGSGLGLATCYSIIKNHGGIIQVSSIVGSGTAVYIYIPAIEAETEAPQVTELSPFIGKGRILLMDDVEMIRLIGGEMIKTLGHEVEFAERGEEAIEKYKAALESGNPFDIVILDLTIRGGMGGRETIERLLAINPEIKAIVSSGYSDDAVISDHHNYGFSARLTKPYNIEELRDTLNQMLSQ